MSEIKISNIEGLSDKDSIDFIEGRLEKLYDFKSGKAKTGRDWALQNGELVDKTGKIRITWKDCEPIDDNLVGK